MTDTDTDKEDRSPEAVLARATKARGEVEIAAEHMIRAYEYGMTQRHVLDAICCVLPMTGMVTGQLGMRAMQLADVAVHKHDDDHDHEHA